MKSLIAAAFLVAASGASASGKSAEDVLSAYMNAWNTHDKQAITNLLATDVSWYDLPSNNVVTGKGKVGKAVTDAFMGYVPDMYWVQSGDVFVSGNTIFYEWTYGGTFNGYWGEQPINSREFSINGVSTTTINKAGKITSQKDYYDLSRFKRALGVIQ